MSVKAPDHIISDLERALHLWQSRREGFKAAPVMFVKDLESVVNSLLALDEAIFRATRFGEDPQVKLAIDATYEVMSRATSHPERAAQ